MIKDLFNKLAIGVVLTLTISSIFPSNADAFAPGASANHFNQRAGTASVALKSAEPNLNKSILDALSRASTTPQELVALGYPAELAEHIEQCRPEKPERSLDPMLLDYCVRAKDAKNKVTLGAGALVAVAAGLTGGGLLYRRWRAQPKGSLRP